VHLAGVRDVRDQQQAADLDVDAGFLARFARGAGFERLVVFHEPAGNCPETEPRLDAPLAQQDAPVVLRHGADDDLRVFVMDHAAVVADMARLVIAFGNPDPDAGPAIAAKVHA
jgi:hypothetical protein